MTHFCVIGPTAIGKSAFAIELAKKHGGEIVSSDAFQVYKGMDVGTAKVTKQEQQQVPHHLVDILEPNEPYSVVEFIKQAESLIQKANQDNVPLVFCGGTGFYVHALLYQYELSGPGEDKAIRHQLMEDAKGQPKDYLWKRLEAVDPKAAATLKPNDEKRLIRAIEYITLTGTSITTLKKKDHPRSDMQIIGLKAERQDIWQRINKRVDLMFEAGLVGEVKSLLDQGYDPSLKAFEAIGYKEVIQHLSGSMSLEEVIELVKLKTRQFSKRQMTWFKRIQNVEWMDAI